MERHDGVAKIPRAPWLLGMPRPGMKNPQKEASGEHCVIVRICQLQHGFNAMSLEVSVVDLVLDENRLGSFTEYHLQPSPCGRQTYS